MESLTIEPADDVSAIIEMFGKELADPARSFTLLAKFRTRDGTHVDVTRLFAEARVSTLQEAGCLAFELNYQPRDTTRFVVYEKWRALADLDAHLRTPYATRLRTAFNGLIEGVPEFSVLTTTR